MDKTILKVNHTQAENGIITMIERYLKLRNEINNTSAYTKDETIKRLSMMNESNILSNLLRSFGIQDIDFDETTYNIEIR